MDAVSADEIERVASLMKIDLGGGGDGGAAATAATTAAHADHVERVQKMLAYFDILDGAGVEDEEVPVQNLGLDMLRTDGHEAYPGRLIDRINNYKGAFVRAPGTAP